MARTKGKTVLLSDEEVALIQQWKQKYKNTYQIFTQFGVTALPKSNKIMSSTYEILFKRPHATISQSVPKLRKRVSKPEPVPTC